MQMPTLLDTLRSYIESSALTKEQREVCYRHGKFVVRACPGSGKTRTVGTRLAWRMANWTSRRSGIAALSFTNVAWGEVGEELLRLGMSARPAWPHFLGTLDSFVNQFVFLPFGHVVMGCSRRPEIVHDNNRAWVDEHMRVHRLWQCYRKGCKPVDFQFAADGSVQYKGPWNQPGPPKCQRDRCRELKAVMVKSGYALHADAMYWGMKILEDAAIRRVIAARFPEIVIDEAQDTSETQTRIVELLADAGSDVVLVGDPDQSIFEFNGARPSLFLAFEKRWGHLPLSANFRSSQHICNATHRFSQLSSPSLAAGPDKDHPLRPWVVEYEAGQEGALLPYLSNILVQQSLCPQGAAVLARRHELVRQVWGDQQTDWPKGIGILSRAFARAGTYRDNGMVREAHEAIMWALLRLCFNKASYGARNEAVEHIGVRAWRRCSWRLLQDLPASSTPLANWGPTVRQVVERFLADVQWGCQADIARTFAKSNDPNAGRPVSSFVRLALPIQGIACKVIHQAKGETYDAVMVVCGAASRKRRGDLEQWLSPNQGEEDERRTGYVAMTRPRKILVLAVPRGTDVSPLKEHFDLGALAPRK